METLKLGWAQSLFVVGFSALCWVVPLAVNQRQDFPIYCCTIDQPYIEDQTVSYALCFVLCFGVAFVAVAASLYCRIKGSGPRHLYVTVTDEAVAFLHGLLLASSVSEGLCAALLKRYVGRPRPHFFSRCGWNGSECTIAVEVGAYQSFPSGHSTLAFATMSFTALFCLGRLQPTKPRALWLGAHIDPRDVLLVAVLSPLGLAAWIAASRVVDHEHHVGDVVAGAALGSFWGAVFYARYFHGPFAPYEGITAAGLPRDSRLGKDAKGPAFLPVTEPEALFLVPTPQGTPQDGSC